MNLKRQKLIRLTLSYIAIAYYVCDYSLSSCMDYRIIFQSWAKSYPGPRIIPKNATLDSL